MADTKLSKIKQAVELLEKVGDVTEIKNALALIGDPVKETTTTSDQVDSQSDFEIGKCYFIRTVTLYQVGRVVSVSSKFVKLEDASWIADTGRFADALKTGKFSEIEPIGNWAVGLGAIVDFGEFSHKLPTDQK